MVTAALTGTAGKMATTGISPCSFSTIARNRRTAFSEFASAAGDEFKTGPGSRKLDGSEHVNSVVSHCGRQVLTSNRAGEVADERNGRRASGLGLADFEFGHGA